MGQAEAVVLSREGAMASVARSGFASGCCGGACRPQARDCQALARVPVPPGWALAPGDRVLLELPARGFLYGLAAAWGIPLVGLFVGALAGALAPASMGFADWQGWQVAGAALGLGGSALLLRRFDPWIRYHPRFRPRIVRHLGR